MLVARIAAAVIAASVLWSGSAQAAGPLHAFRLGFWSGGAYTDDHTGGFTHCSAGAAYDSGINMFVLVTGELRWWLGFINPHWALAPNPRQPVELRLDKGAAFARVAIVPSRQLLLVPLPDNSRLIETFRRSSQLSLTAEKETFLFKLSDASAVMNELAGCVRSSVALEAQAPSPPASTGTGAQLPLDGAAPLSAISSPADPPSAAATRISKTPAPAQAAAPAAARRAPTEPEPPAAIVASAVAETPISPPAATAPAVAPPQLVHAPQSGQAPQSGTATENEEVRLARDFLVTAQLPNARLVFADKPAALASFTAVWRSDNAAGAVKVIPPGPDVSGIGIASNLIAVDPQMCKGDFTSARSSANIDSKVVFSAVLSCTEDSEQRTAKYFITPRLNGGFVVFAVVGSGAAEGTAATDRGQTESLTKAAVRAAGNGG